MAAPEGFEPLASLIRTTELIRADRAHGASWLAREATRALATAAEAPSDDLGATLRAIQAAARELASTRPSMAILANMVARIWQAGLSVTPSDARARLAAISDAARRSLEVTVGETAERMLASARPLLRGTIITHSRSNSVEMILTCLVKERAVERVIATESRPGGEGVALARALATQGARVTLVADAACGVFVREASAMVVGADSIRADGGVVNKVGTYPLALAAGASGVPVYIVAETGKIAPTNLPLVFEEMAGTELLPEPVAGITPRNPYFEYTPPELITAVITEEGMLSREEIRERAERAEAALASLLAETLSET